MNKIYKFEQKKTYCVYVEKVGALRDGVKFDAKILPEKGHQLTLKNITYSPTTGLHVPRGSGFNLQITSRLSIKLRQISKDLLKQLEDKPKVKAEKRDVPKLFDRSAIENSKQIVSRGNNK